MAKNSIDPDTLSTFAGALTMVSVVVMLFASKSNEFGIKLISTSLYLALSFIAFKILAGEDSQLMKVTLRPVGLLTGLGGILIIFRKLYQFQAITTAGICFVLAGVIYGFFQVLRRRNELTLGHCGAVLAQSLLIGAVFDS